MASHSRRPSPGARCRPVLLPLLLLAALGGVGLGTSPSRVASQDLPPNTGAADSLALADTLTEGPVASDSPFPVFVVLGLGYGSRSDDCVLCESIQDNESFTGHLTVARPLGKGFAVGLGASVWRRSRPGTPVSGEEAELLPGTSLTNTLGNVSVSLFYRVWHVYVRAGGGVAFGSQDLESEGPDGGVLVHTASGWGVGYSAGGGVTVPLASVVSLSVFGNWNVGRYDMISPQGVSERGAQHRYLEVGVGLGVG